MSEPIAREECTQSMSRVHERVDKISDCSIEIATSAKNIEKAVCEMHKIIYGNEKGEGLITKVSTLWQRVSGIYWLGGVIVVALIGTLIGMMFKNGK